MYRARGFSHARLQRYVKVYCLPRMRPMHTYAMLKMWGMR